MVVAPMSAMAALVLVVVLRPAPHSVTLDALAPSPLDTPAMPEVPALPGTALPTVVEASSATVTAPPTTEGWPAEGFPAAFDPPRHAGGGVLSLPLRFLDGTRVLLTLPERLATLVTSFVPTAMACADQRCTVGRTLEVIPGSVDALYGHREPAAVYRDAAGGPVPFYDDGDLHHLVFEFGGWVVRAWDRPGTAEGFNELERGRFALSLGGEATPDGFLRLTSREAPLRSADAPDGMLTGDGLSVAVFLRQCSGPQGATETPWGYQVSQPGAWTSVCALEERVEVAIEAAGGLAAADLDALRIRVLDVGPILAEVRPWSCLEPHSPLRNEDVVALGDGFYGGAVNGYDAASGALRWTVPVGTTAFVGVVTHDTVIAMPQYGAVVALDSGTGHERWRVELDPAESATSVAGDNEAGIVVVGSSFPVEADVRAPRVRGIDLANGEVRWLTELLPGLDLQHTAPVLVEGLALLTDTLSHPHSAPTSYLHALDLSSGTLAWRADLHDSTQGFHCRGPEVADGTVTVVTDQGGHRSFDLIRE